MLGPMEEQGVAQGILLARGVCRALDALGFVPICEYPVTRSLRVDVLALGPKGEVWIIECKSSLADFRADQKWQGYLPWCDRFFWAVGPDFPCTILPEGHGLFLADAYGGEMMRIGPETRLAPARRKALLLGVAQAAGRRLHRMTDPQGRG
ncbi:MmcB family DNA repair protein [Roseibaca calidilacus]|uniref:DNA repair protein MmcB-related protein n=2 Tax=Roseibaca calidilacus TaxID=1666912 RepID=A0ABM9VUR1_9RHOB|nr:hypothetical protein Ga0058931_1990 [Roseibaca calidilacus]